jgi:hypothetical protein
MSDREDPRAERAARNEMLFRSVNERMEELGQRGSDGTPDEGSVLRQWICECVDATCTTRVALTMPKYQAVRAHETWFIVAADHVYPEFERIVERQVDFWVVEKTGAAREAVVEASEDDS